MFCESLISVSRTSCTTLRKTQDRLSDDVMLGLRLREGLDLNALARKYGSLAAETVKAGAAEGLRRGWVELVVENEKEEASPHVLVDGDQHLGGERAVEGSIRGSGGDSAGGDTDSARGVGVMERALTVDVDDDCGRGVVTGGTGGGYGVGRVTRLRLSDPDGFLFSNSVISSVFCKLDQLHASGGGQNRSNTPPAAAVAAEL